MNTVSVLWRRLDAPGHDACRLEQTNAGWTLDGAAVFREDGLAAGLTYHLACDQAWRTVEGRVHGWFGQQSLEFRITRGDSGLWTFNGAAVPGLESYVDLDFGFTPATNLPQLRRIALDEGRAADVPVAWLDFARGTLTSLPQRYERRSKDSYWYESPSFQYQALLEVDEVGFVRLYPGLWEMES
jgi:hypothetical protein